MPFFLYFLGAKIVIIYDNNNNINLVFGFSCIKKKNKVTMLIFSVMFNMRRLCGLFASGIYSLTARNRHEGVFFSFFIYIIIVYGKKDVYLHVKTQKYI